MAIISEEPAAGCSFVIFFWYANVLLLICHLLDRPLYITSNLLFGLLKQEVITQAHCLYAIYQKPVHVTSNTFDRPTSLWESLLSFSYYLDGLESKIFFYSSYYLICHKILNRSCYSIEFFSWFGIYCKGLFWIIKFISRNCRKILVSNLNSYPSCLDVV